MNSELEKLIEKYRITVNGLADLESGYDEVIKDRGFVTLNGLLVEPAANTEENTSVSPAPVESAEVHNEPTPVVPAPAANSAENTPGAPAPVENPGVTPAPSEPVSNDTNLGNESAAAHSPSGEVAGEGSNEPNPSGERSADENASDDDTTSTEEPAAGGKPKKKQK